MATLSPRSVEAFASRLLERRIPVHVLINNAAEAPLQRTTSVDGFELQFATNVCGCAHRDIVPSCIVHGWMLYCALCIGPCCPVHADGFELRFATNVCDDA